MGDAKEEEDKKTNEKYKLPKMDILKRGHHSSKDSLNLEFIKYICPSYAFIQSGKYNLYSHPHKDVIKRFESIKTTIYSISDYGNLK